MKQWSSACTQSYAVLYKLDMCFPHYWQMATEVVSLLSTCLLLMPNMPHLVYYPIDATSRITIPVLLQVTLLSARSVEWATGAYTWQRTWENIVAKRGVPVVVRSLPWCAPCGGTWWPYTACPGRRSAESPTRGRARWNCWLNSGRLELEGSRPLLPHLPNLRTVTCVVTRSETLTVMWRVLKQWRRGDASWDINLA